MLTPGEIHNYRCFKDYVRKGCCRVYTHENAMQSNAVHNIACAMEKRPESSGQSADHDNRQ